MKKNKLKSLIKSSRRFTTKEIEKTLIEQISGSLLQYNLDSKKVKKELANASKKLAKKLSKEIKVDKDELRQSNKTIKVSSNAIKTNADLLPAVIDDHAVSSQSANTLSKVDKPKSYAPQKAINSEADVNEMEKEKEQRDEQPVS
ncbi:MAG: hypothetical protein JWQ25_881 [Daejeonella sp.]|nr:hypothetical protein [Daejeonella sp.]